MNRTPVAIALACCALALGCADDGASGSCVLNSDCALTETCAEGRCVPECREDRDCPAGMSCVGQVCGGATDTGDSDGRDLGDDVTPPDATGDVVSDTGSTDTTRPGGVGAISGRVHFRLYDDSTLPVAEPIVYWADVGRPPEPLAVGASCDCGYPADATRGGADGEFTLTDVPAGPVLLVIQKGEFRRIREVTIVADSTVPAPTEATELPVRDDPESGDEIPNIVIGTGRFDPIEDVFAKLRMGPLNSRFEFDFREYLADPDAWGVTLMAYQDPAAFDDESYDDIDWSVAVDDYLELLGDSDALARWDFLFSPCAETSGYGAAMTSETNRDNVRAYVNEGGKLYVTDYAYDMIEQPFPEYIDFTNPAGENTNADGAVGDPDRMGIATQNTLRYDSPGRALSPLLRQWLFALDSESEGYVDTEGNWVNIRDVGAGDQCCRDGETVAVTPEVVISGPNQEDRGVILGEGVFYDTWAEAEADDANHPHTLRFPYGCGEVMYSTYHTKEYTERTADLNEQELVLLWLILEVNECNLDPIKE